VVRQQSGVVEFLLRQFAQPSIKKAPHRFLSRKAQGLFVSGSRFRCSSEPATHIGSRGVRKVVVSQIAAQQNGIDKCQTSRRSIPHGHGDGTVKFDYG